MPESSSTCLVAFVWVNDTKENLKGTHYAPIELNIVAYVVVVK